MIASNMLFDSRGGFSGSSYAYVVLKSYGAEVERVTPSERLQRMTHLTNGPEAMTEFPSVDCLHLITGHAR